MNAGARVCDRSAGYSGYEAHTSGLLGYRPGTVSSSGSTTGTRLRGTQPNTHMLTHSFTHTQ